MLTAGSLFSGIGGIDLAFSIAGFDIRWQVEQDEFCRHVLEKNEEYWKNASRAVTDVRNAGSKNLESVDVIFGGFPCQDISSAGKRAGLEGARSGLWWQMHRIISELRPRAVLLENVAAITYSQSDEETGDLRPADAILVINSLAEIGYDAQWQIISAADAGAPHLRERWFCLGYADGTRLQKPEQTRRQADSAKNKRGLHNRLKRPSVLPTKKRLAYTNRKRRAKVRGYRAKARKRAIRANSVGNTSSKRTKASQQQRELCSGVKTSGEMGNNNRTGFRKHRRGKSIQTRYGATKRTSRRKRRGQTKSRLVRGADGISGRLDGHQLMAHRFPAPPGPVQHDHEPPRVDGAKPHRRARIKALGNAVVPQCVYPVAKLLQERMSS